MNVGLAVACGAVTGIEVQTPGAPAFQEAWQEVERFSETLPLRIAKIDEQGRQVSDWFEYGSGIAELCGARICFDAAEFLDGRPTDGLYGQNCLMGSTRYFAGAQACRPVVVNDMEMLGACGNVELGRVQFAWWWQVRGGVTAEHCYVLMRLYDVAPAACGDIYRGFVDGFVLDFGVLTSSASVGYRSADVSLCLLPQPFTVLSPKNGSGAYEMVLAKAYDPDTGRFTVGTCAQPMLWGTGKPFNGSVSLALQLEDRNGDGVINPSKECFELDPPVCPHPLSAMMAFWQKGDSQGGTPPKLRLSCSTKGTRVDLKARLDNGTPGDEVTFILDGQIQRKGKVNAAGGVAKKFKDVGAGPHTVQVPKYGLQRGEKCQ